jgi:hypothetical protein
VAREDFHLFKQELPSILAKDITYKKQWIILVEAAAKDIRTRGWMLRQQHIEREQQRVHLINKKGRLMENWLQKQATVGSQ